MHYEECKKCCQNVSDKELLVRDMPPKMIDCEWDCVTCTRLVRNGWVDGCPME